MPDNTAQVKLLTNEQIQNMVVNGQPIQQRTKLYTAACEYCGRVLVNFNPGERYVNVVNCLDTQVRNDLKYCPGCGAKLNYNFGIVEAEVKTV